MKAVRANERSLGAGTTQRPVRSMSRAGTRSWMRKAPCSAAGTGVARVVR